jgi:hypothetical protein
MKPPPHFVNVGLYPEFNSRADLFPSFPAYPRESLGVIEPTVFETALFHASVSFAFSEIEGMNCGAFPNSNAGYLRGLAVSKGCRGRPRFDTLL